MDHREDGGVRADAKGERQHSDDLDEHVRTNREATFSERWRQVGHAYLHLRDSTMRVVTNSAQIAPLK